MIFPQQEQVFYLVGPAGRLQCQVDYPHQSQQRQAIVIVCHPHPLQGGTMTNKVVTTVARSFNTMGLIAIRFNYRGVGESEGKYGDTIGEAEDLSFIVNWLKQQKPDNQIYLAGFSFGTVVASRIASDPDIKQLLLIAPPVNHYDFTRLPKPRCPRLVIQGEADEIVPVEQVREWVAQEKTTTEVNLFARYESFFS